jgi:DNA-binding NarL/FixJ family response regulator
MANDKQSNSATQEKWRILLVDDHPMVRERLAEVIEREPDLTVCGEAEDRFGALDVIATERPQLAIIDLTLKDSQGIELIKDIRSRFPETLMLVVSMHDELLHAERVIRAGAKGYITKQEATRKVMLAIRTVLKGEVYLSEKMAARIAARALGSPKTENVSPMTRLSDRELSVFEMIGRGHSTRQIADTLHLDMRTVETYRARIKEKLNLKDGNDLLHFAIRWVQAEESP